MHFIILLWITIVSRGGGRHEFPLMPPFFMGKCFPFSYCTAIELMQKKTTAIYVHFNGKHFLIIYPQGLLVFFYFTVCCQVKVSFPFPKSSKQGKIEQSGDNFGFKIKKTVSLTFLIVRKFEIKIIFAPPWSRPRSLSFFLFSTCFYIHITMTTIIYNNRASNRDSKEL